MLHDYSIDVVNYHATPLLAQEEHNPTGPELALAYTMSPD